MRNAPEVVIMNVSTSAKRDRNMRTTFYKTLILKLANTLVLSSGLAGFDKPHEVLPTIGGPKQRRGQANLGYAHQSRGNVVPH